MQKKRIGSHIKHYNTLSYIECYFHFFQGAMKQIVLNMADQHNNKNASRAKIICSMIEKQSNSPNAVSGLMRPKSAPGHIVGKTGKTLIWVGFNSCCKIYT